MDDGFDAVLADDAADKILVADIADDEGGVGGHRPAEPGRQVVEHDDALPGIEELEHHVASDVPGSAGDENGHRLMCLPESPAFAGTLASQNLI